MRQYIFEIKCKTVFFLPIFLCFGISLLPKPVYSARLMRASILQVTFDINSKCNIYTHFIRTHYFVGRKLVSVSERRCIGTSILIIYCIIMLHLTAPSTNFVHYNIISYIYRMLPAWIDSRCRHTGQNIMFGQYLHIMIRTSIYVKRIKNNNRFLTAFSGK